MVNVKAVLLKLHHETHMYRGENQVSQIAIILPSLGFRSLFFSSNGFECVWYRRVLIF